MVVNDKNMASITSTFNFRFYENEFVIACTCSILFSKTFKFLTSFILSLLSSIFFFSCRTCLNSIPCVTSTKTKKVRPVFFNTFNQHQLCVCVWGEGPDFAHAKYSISFKFCKNFLFYIWYSLSKAAIFWILC